MSPIRQRWNDEIATQSRYSQRFGGVDHGTTGKILAEVRKGNDIHRRLVWFKGGKRASCGVRGFGQDSFPVSLRVIDKSGLWVDDIFMGGRLTKDRLTEYAGKIDKALDCELATSLDLKHTVYAVIESGGEHEQ